VTEGDIRVDLGEFQAGAYALVRGTVPWGLAQRLAEAESLSPVQFIDLALRQMVEEFGMRGRDGEPLPPPRDMSDAQIDALDARVVARLATAIREVLSSLAPSPNAESASSIS
jgi:hypothetical protein